MKKKNLANSLMSLILLLRSNHRYTSMSKSKAKVLTNYFYSDMEFDRFLSGNRTAVFQTENYTSRPKQIYCGDTTCRNQTSFRTPNNQCCVV